MGNTNTKLGTQGVRIFTQEDERVAYNNSEVDSLLHIIAQDRADEAAAKAHRQEATDKLAALVGNATKIVDDHDDVVATWNEIKVDRFDTTRFKVDFPKVYEQYLKESLERRLLIKKVW